MREMGIGMDYKKDVNILIVDDVSVNLAILAEILHCAGYATRSATSAKEAMEAVKELPPQLILLDASMPEMDGYEFCSLLKADARTREIPVIFISAMTSQEDKKKGFRVGAVDFITKPFDSDEVTLRVNTQVKNYVMQRELTEYNRRLHKMMSDQIRKVTEDQKNLIYALVRLAETREDPTGTHMENVAANARLLAQSLQFSLQYEKEVSNNFIDDIELAAPLHDIGNMGIKDRILLKNGKLTPDEMEVMKTHTEVGARALADIHARNEYSRYLKMAADIAYYHHERWDGDGYPRGLKGRQIPLAARIVSVVDVYDVLLREKCYKAAYSHEKSMQIIVGEAGKSFDPGIVEVLCKIQNQLRRDGT